MRREITGFSNPLLKEVRALREKKHRKRAALFLAEGLRIMTEAREASFLPEMLFRVAGREVHALEIALEADVLAAGGDVIETSADIMAKLSGKENSQAIVGVYRDHPTPLLDIDRNTAPIWLVAQAMRDPGNLGTMLRTGDAVGAGGLHRSIFGRGGAGEHGCDFHAKDCAVPMARLRGLAAASAGTTGRHQPTNQY
jgi:TrmH family RNA methyltransferase